MKDPETDIEQTITKDEQKSLFEAAHKLFLLYLGFLALTIEEIEELVGKLIERGEIAEQDSRKLLREMMDKQQEKAQEAENGVYKQIESVMERASLASKSDIDALNKKITRLRAQLDELKVPEPEL
jgi:polyhydroxyalkanoate synthesis regulator phasin